MSRAPARILLTTDAVGGVWTYSLDLAALLARRGMEVELALLGPALASAQQQAVAALPGVRLHETGLPLEWLADSQALAALPAALAALARCLRVELVQLHSPALVGDVIWPAPVLAVLHSCPGTWWRAVRGTAPPPEEFLWRMAAVRRGLARVEIVIAPSRALARLAATVYGLSREIRVVANARPDVALPGGPREGILCAGRLWDEGKNIALLDRAAALARLPAAAAGPLQGPHGAAIGLTGLRWLGVLAPAALAREMARARLFAAPALYEPFGLAVLEAAQQGAALVLSDIPTFRELWRGAALFLPRDDASAWAAALARLHEQPETCAAWGARARRRARRYAAARFEAAMLSLYGLPAVPPLIRAAG
ncbi:MAG TPA: glycosyltransferase [Acidocella sp.]|jgi:glycosyltransferase involved in cell wall biosynthesis|nr:glycosyltransferase [Acidocella sp.]